jgi:alkylation response protein AidB-like acyl-CoA dehydrogenase
MDFHPNDTQQMLTTSVERLLSETYDLHSRLRSRDRHADDRLWASLAELGLLGVETDETYGGTGGTFEDLSAAIRPMGAALVSLPFISTAVVASGLLNRASSGQKTRWLPALVNGALRACVAHVERRARDVLSWVETAARFEDGKWRLDGAKAVALGGDSAGLFLVSARTTGAPIESHGISLFAVPRETEGLRISAYSLYDGTGAADLTLEGVLLADNALLGDRDSAYADLALAWDRGTAAVCVEAIGAMDALRDLTVDYLKTREQFGRPIGQFQALQHRMVDAYMAIELARSMSLLAVAAIVEKDASMRTAHVSAAKVVVGDACREVGQTCVQLHGGIALTTEYPAGHYFKRLTMIERMFGTPDHHLRRYANTL